MNLPSSNSHWRLLVLVLYCFDLQCACECFDVAKDFVQPELPPQRLIYALNRSDRFSSSYYFSRSHVFSETFCLPLLWVLHFTMSIYYWYAWPSMKFHYKISVRKRNFKIYLLEIKNSVKLHNIWQMCGSIKCIFFGKMGNNQTSW